MRRVEEPPEARWALFEQRSASGGVLARVQTVGWRAKEWSGLRRQVDSL